jgi:hypothetical protein
VRLSRNKTGDGSSTIPLESSVNQDFTITMKVYALLNYAFMRFQPITTHCPIVDRKEKTNDGLQFMYLGLASAAHPTIH